MPYDYMKDMRLQIDLIKSYLNQISELQEQREELWDILKKIKNLIDNAFSNKEVITYDNEWAIPSKKIGLIRALICKVLEKEDEWR